MAHYAWLDKKNIVVHIMPGRDEDVEVDDISDWEDHYSKISGYKVLRTSYNTHGGIHYDNATGEPSGDQSKSFRGNYAGIGYKYYEDLDAFVPPQPYASWNLNEKTYTWTAPVPYPEDGLVHDWDEETLSWISQGE